MLLVHGVCGVRDDVLDEELLELVSLAAGGQSGVVRGDAPLSSVLALLNSIRSPRSPTDVSLFVV